MRNLKPFIFLVITMLLVVSCEEDMFGPGSYAGRWDVTEYNADFEPMSFNSVIEYIPGDSTRILIGNFSGLGQEYKVESDIAGNDLTIPFQTINGNGGRFSVTGSGKASSNMRKIDWVYKVDGEDFTAIFEK